MKADFGYKTDLSFNGELPNEIQRFENRLQARKQKAGLQGRCFQMVNGCWENSRSRKRDSMSLKVFKPRLRAFLNTRVEFYHVTWVIQG